MAQYLLSELAAAHNTPLDWLPAPSSYSLHYLRDEPYSPGSSVDTAGSSQWSTTSLPSSPESDHPIPADIQDSPSVAVISNEFAAGMNLGYPDFLPLAADSFGEPTFPFFPYGLYAELEPTPEDEFYKTIAPQEDTINPMGLALTYSPCSTPLSPVPELPFPNLPEVPPVRASADRASALVSNILADGSDVDAEGESEAEYEDGASDDDDEYVPSPLPPLSQRRAYQNVRNARSSPTSSRKVSRKPSRPARKPSTMAHMAAFERPDADDGCPRVIRTAPRRVQVEYDLPASPDQEDASKGQWGCPHCSYIQRNRREPDLRRHISTHFRDQNKNKYICCGVPLHLAEQYDVPGNTDVMYFWGTPMVGGCAKELSRKDALKRHLRNSPTCAGNLAGGWHPFNKTGA